MQNTLRTPFFLSLALVGLMAVQSTLGLAFPEAYRDVEWIRATWLGNDWVTLSLGVPLFGAALLLTRRGSARGLLIWLGMLGYGAYNYAFYLLGAAVNRFFPVYVLAVLLSVIALILVLSRIEAQEVAEGFRPQTPRRTIGGYLMVLALGLTTVWMGMWALHVFGGKPTPVEPEAFRLIAALDLTIMAPALLTGGLLLWKRTPWGHVIAAIAGIQASIYLVVLSVNSGIAVVRGLAEAPGEIPVWGPMALLTATATSVLLANAEKRR